MPDDRMLHKRLGLSRKVSDLTDFEFRVWVQYQLTSDDCGLMLASAAPLQADNLALNRARPAKVEKAIDRLVQVGLLRTFEHQGSVYLCQLDWQDWQKVRYPRESHLPIPPPATLELMTPKTVALFEIRIRARAASSPESSRDHSGDHREESQAPARAGGIAKRLTANGDRPTAVERDQRFAAFWAAYPRKVAKAAAKAEYAKVNPDGSATEAIQAGLERALASPTWRRNMAEPDMPHIPHARTWLHQRRWEDEATSTSAEQQHAKVAPDLRELCAAAGLKNADVTQWFTGASLSKNGHGLVHLVIPDADVRESVQRLFGERLEQAVIAKGGASLEVVAS